MAEFESRENEFPLVEGKMDCSKYPLYLRSLIFTPEELSHIRTSAEAAAKQTIENSKSDVNSVDGNQWKLEFVKLEIANLHVYSSQATGTKIRRFKAVVELPYSPADLWDFVSRDDHRITWDRNIHDLTTITVCEDAAEKKRFTVMRCGTKAVGPIAGRDFVDANLIHTLEDGSIVSSGSAYVNTEKLPESTSFTRGCNFPSGWYFVPIDGGKKSRVNYIIHTDLRGWFLPIIINNAIAGTYIDFFRDLIQALEGSNIAKSDN